MDDLARRMWRSRVHNVVMKHWKMHLRSPSHSFVPEYQKAQVHSVQNRFFKIKFWIFQFSKLGMHCTDQFLTTSFSTTTYWVVFQQHDWLTNPPQDRPMLHNHEVVGEDNHTGRSLVLGMIKIYNDEWIQLQRCCEQFSKEDSRSFDLPFA